ncbi:isochorismatase [Erythrobacter sp. KY5]|uniref:isochorismatase family protein n=1 Tax=Erythrobacter sp. KY5 TaxID=2011159 RepID=UPI000DBF0D22|nr:isochorismatase family protein [Erythrobacter sp. KY5]AWW74271.1 isochorismatase [Erythrobacter sp. KY5]
MTDWDGAFAGKLTPGKSPALLLVDPVRAYVEPAFPLFLESGSAAISHMAQLADEFRKRHLPVIWTGVRYSEGGGDGGHFFRKVPALEIFVGDTTAGSFPEQLIPHGEEPVFFKQYPSAFFGTALDDWLHDHGVDTLYIGGFSTSGCVRASALDALQHGFVPIAISDACADRDEELHGSNLRDLGAKYSEIVRASQVPQMLDSGELPGD